MKQLDIVGISVASFDSNGPHFVDQIGVDHKNTLRFWGLKTMA